MPYVINAGSVDDIRTSLKHCQDRLTIKQLRTDLEDEKDLPGHKRSTVIRMLVVIIEKKLKQAGAKSTPGICRICLCTQNHACPDPDTGNCWWVHEDLCSACASPAQKKTAMNEMRRLNEQSLKSLKVFKSALQKNFKL